MAGDGRHADDEPDEEVVLRPEFVVLGEGALVPEANVVRPPPTRFTHELMVDEPYYLDRPDRAAEADGVMRAGTRVALLEQSDDRCRVVDGSGLSVDVRRASLRELPARPDS
jgi:hypothetical protein